ncbi:hypothetical protein BpHYR1_028647 [Brachionus plicatilis]|uniref:Uncharacterized protein n=1 Tax=Brachionus plicatilis TaxID=10195 RepID=A0A3M7RCP1_BRAPC|nr:hypothetical protein BpHYR1_028647 [Brachionus plicatilis]
MSMAPLHSGSNMAKNDFRMLNSLDFSDSLSEELKSFGAFSTIESISLRSLVILANGCFIIAKQYYYDTWFNDQKVK